MIWHHRHHERCSRHRHERPWRHGWFGDFGFGAFDLGAGRPRGARRGGRMFDQGDLKLVILQLLEEKPRHGYDIIKELGERVGGEYSPSPGVVYPTLTMLEDMGYASASVDAASIRAPASAVTWADMSFMGKPS